MTKLISSKITVESKVILIYVQSRIHISNRFEFTAVLQCQVYVNENGNKDIDTEFTDMINIIYRGNSIKLDYKEFKDFKERELVFGWDIDKEIKGEIEGISNDEDFRKMIFKVADRKL